MSNPWPARTRNARRRVSRLTPSISLSILSGGSRSPADNAPDSMRVIRLSAIWTYKGTAEISRWTGGSMTDPVRACAAIELMSVIGIPVVYWYTPIHGPYSNTQPRGVSISRTSRVDLTCAGMKLCGGPALFPCPWNPHPPRRDYAGQTTPPTYAGQAAHPGKRPLMAWTAIARPRLLLLGSGLWPGRGNVPWIRHPKTRSQAPSRDGRDQDKVERSGNGHLQRGAACLPRPILVGSVPMTLSRFAPDDLSWDGGDGGTCPLRPGRRPG